MRLLLVEDEPFIALDLELLLRAAGHEVVGVADTLDDALELAASRQPDAALVDINLRDGMTGLDVARALGGTRGIPVAFVTGNAEQIPADFAGALAVVEKPFTEQGVHEVMSILDGARHGGPEPNRPARYVRTAPPA